jgi:hypothetical protein
VGDCDVGVIVGVAVDSGGIAVGVLVGVGVAVGSSLQPESGTPTTSNALSTTGITNLKDDRFNFALPEI